MTANELIENFFEEQYSDGLLDGSIVDYQDDIKTLMLQFAKLHVEAALKAASEKAKVHLKTYWADSEDLVEEAKVFWGSDDPQNCYSSSVKVDKNSITNAYSLDEIK